MPIKDIIRIYECKYCKKKFTMFERPNGELVYFPENVMWPVHGEFELTDHVRNKHRREYDLNRVFYDDDSLINLNFHKVAPNEEVRM